MVRRPSFLLALFVAFAACPAADDDDSAMTPEPTPVADDDSTDTDPCTDPILLGGDLAVREIARTPRFAALPILYDPPGFNPTVDPSVAGDPEWPEVGETVLFTSAVVNQGPGWVDGYRWQWMIDGVPHGSGLTRDVDPGVAVPYEKEWTWEDGPHEVELLLSGMDCAAVNDAVAGNDGLGQRTDAWLFTIYLWPDFFHWMEDHENTVGSRSASDWVRFQVDELNRLWDESPSPLLPDGVRPRVGIDRFVIVPDGTPDPGGDHVPEPCLTDGCLGFVLDLPWIEAVIDGRDDELLRTWSRQLGLIDPRAMDVHADEVSIEEGAPGAVVDSSSSAGTAIDLLWDGDLETPILTAEARPVWFAVEFDTERTIVSTLAAFPDGLTHSWELWSGPSLAAVRDQTSDATLVVGPVETTGTEPSEEIFAGIAARAWAFHVTRSDGDQMTQVAEWSLREETGPVDVLALLLSAQVAGSEWMPLIVGDLVHLNSVPADLMSGAGFSLDPYHAWALDRESDWQGRGLPGRRGGSGTYLAEIPNENALVILRDGAPAEGSQVEVFRRLDNHFDDVVKYEGVTDVAGVWEFPSQTTASWGIFVGEAGPLPTLNPFSTPSSDGPNLSGSNGVLLVRVTHGDGATVYRFLDLPMWNLLVAAEDVVGSLELDMTPGG